MKTKTRRLLQPIWNAFDAFLLPHAHTGLILCVSGGSDSRALMESVAHWPKRFEKIQVVSIDHNTRSETGFEAQAVCARARVLGFESHVLSLYPVLKKDEASLRAGRYGVIWQLARDLGLGAIVTAHTQDDQAESFMMDMMGHGGGAEGSAMPYSNRHCERSEAIQDPWIAASAAPPRNDGYLLRPLLDFSRAYLIAVLTELGQDYFVDPTNEQSMGKRVQVRDFLKLHDRPHERLAGLAQKRSADLAALQSWACELIEVHSSGKVSVSFEPETPEAVLIQAFKKALTNLLPDEDLRNAHKTLSLMAKNQTGQYDLPGCVAEMRSGNVIFFTVL